MLILVVIISILFVSISWKLSEPFKSNFASDYVLYHVEGLGLRENETVAIHFVDNELNIITWDTILKLDFRKVLSYRLTTVQAIMNEQDLTKAVKSSFWFGRAGTIIGSASQDVVKNIPVFIFKYDGKDGDIEVVLTESPESNSGILQHLYQAMNFRKGIDINEMTEETIREVEI